MEAERERQKRSTKQTRELREDLTDAQHKLEDSERRRADLSARLEQLEADYAQAQADVRLSFRRIAELQAQLDDEMHSEGDATEDGYDATYSYVLWNDCIIFGSCHFRSNS